MSDADDKQIAPKFWKQHKWVGEDAEGKAIDLPQPADYAAGALHRPTDRLDRWSDIRGAMRRAYLMYDQGQISETELTKRVWSLRQLAQTKKDEDVTKALESGEAFVGLMLGGIANDG